MSPLLPRDLQNWSCDEDYVAYLAGRRDSDPIPEGITTDIDPFSSNPWDLPDDRWYLLQQGIHCGDGESCVKTENGFWRLVSTSTIRADSFLGWKHVFEFYQGDTPIGTRTGWLMHQYRAGSVVKGAGHMQVNSSLCRIFWYNGERLNSSEQNNSLASCANFNILEADMLKRNEEREAPSRREADEDVFVNISHGSFIEMRDLMFSDGEIASCTSNRDYLEQNDILTSDTASTSSENSSRTSVNSDKCIDLDELLGEFRRDGPVPMEDEKKLNCVSSATEPVQSDRADGGALLDFSKDCFLELKDVLSSDRETSKPNHHLSDEGYVELRDLTSNRTSTNSGNLNCIRINPDEYFNVDELLRDIARDGTALVKEPSGNFNCMSIDPDEYFSVDELLRDIARDGTALVEEHSGNFNCMSNNPDEYFSNVDELLRDITRDGTALVEEQQKKVDCGFCIKSPIHSNRVVLLPGSESVGGFIGNLEVACKNAQPMDQLDLDQGLSTSACSHTSQVKRNLSDRSTGAKSSSSGGSGSSNDGSSNSSGSKSPQSKRRKSISRLAKFSKKLFCFL